MPICYEVITLRKWWKYFLNSFNKSMGPVQGNRFCNQQAVKTHFSLGCKRESKNAPVCPVGAPVACNSIIQITHNSSGKNLHSHQFCSCLSGQQEISCFSEGSEGVEDDDWILICDSEFWTRGWLFCLQHAHTDKYLGATQRLKCM